MILLEKVIYRNSKKNLVWIFNINKRTRDQIKMFCSIRFWFKIKIFSIAKYIILDVFSSNISFMMKYFSYFTCYWIKFRLSYSTNITIDNVIGNKFKFMFKITVYYNVVWFTSITCVTYCYLIILCCPKEWRCIKISF